MTESHTPVMCSPLIYSIPSSSDMSGSITVEILGGGAVGLVTGMVTLRGRPGGGAGSGTGVGDSARELPPHELKLSSHGRVLSSGCWDDAAVPGLLTLKGGPAGIGTFGEEGPAGLPDTALSVAVA